MSAKARRILFTSTYAQPYLSGITDYISNVTKFIAKTNPVTLVSFQHDSSLPIQESAAGVELIRLPFQLKLSKGFINFLYPWLIWQQVKNHDQVFINAPQVEGIFVAIAAKLLRKPLTVIYHCELFFETGWGLKLVANIANFLSWLTVAMSDQVIVYTLDYAEASPVLKNWLKKVVVLPPPIFLEKADEKFYQKLSELTRNNFPILGFSGRVSKEKGLEYLLAALENLQNEFPKIKLICAGPFGNDVAGELGYFEKIKSIIDSKKLPVEFLGRLSKPELSAFYQKITLLTLPSTNKTEAFGMVQAEALLHGKPVVVSNLPGVRACVQLTSCGEVVTPKNSRELALAITKLVKNLPTEKHVAQQAKKYFGGSQTAEWFQTFVTAD